MPVLSGIVCPADIGITAECVILYVDCAVPANFDIAHSCLGYVLSVFSILLLGGSCSCFRRFVAAFIIGQSHEEAYLRASVIWRKLRQYIYEHALGICLGQRHIILYLHALYAVFIEHEANQILRLSCRIYSIFLPSHASYASLIDAKYLLTAISCIC